MPPRKGPYRRSVVYLGCRKVGDAARVLEWLEKGQLSSPGRAVPPAWSFRACSMGQAFWWASKGHVLSAHRSHGSSCTRIFQTNLSLIFQFCSYPISQAICPHPGVYVYSYSGPLPSPCKVGGQAARRRPAHSPPGLCTGSANISGYPSCKPCFSTFLSRQLVAEHEPIRSWHELKERNGGQLRSLDACSCPLLGPSRPATPDLQRTTSATWSIAAMPV